MFDTQVIILAGGLGTRLYPLSVERPKALLPVCNVSLLARLLAQLHAAGFRCADVTLPAMPQHTRKLALASAPRGFDLVIADAARPFGGQVPAVRALLAAEAAAVLVIYGDSLLSLDFGALMNSHAASRAHGALATIVWHRPADLKLAESDGRTYHGVMSVNQQGRVTRFEEKPLVEHITDGFDMANAAVFICERALLGQVDFRGAKNFSYDLFEPAVKENRAALFGFGIGAGFRYDLGSVARYFDANLQVLRGDLAGPIPGTKQSSGFWIGDQTAWEEAQITPPVLLGSGVYLGREARIGPDVVIGDGCRIGAGATIRQAVLMENCRIGAGARLDTCVLGPFAQVGQGVSLSPRAVLGAFCVVGLDDWPNWAEVVR